MALTSIRKRRGKWEAYNTRTQKVYARTSSRQKAIKAASSPTTRTQHVKKYEGLPE